MSLRIEPRALSARTREPLQRRDDVVGARAEVTSGRSLRVADALNCVRRLRRCRAEAQRPAVPRLSSFDESTDRIFGGDLRASRCCVCPYEETESRDEQSRRHTRLPGKQRARPSASQTRCGVSVLNAWRHGHAQGTESTDCPSRVTLDLDVLQKMSLNCAEATSYERSRRMIGRCVATSEHA